MFYLSKAFKSYHPPEIRLYKEHKAFLKNKGVLDSSSMKARLDLGGIMSNYMRLFKAEHLYFLAKMKR